MPRSTIRDLMRRLQEIESERDEAQAIFVRLQLQVEGYKAVIADQEEIGVGVEPVSSQVLHDEMERILEEQGKPLHRKAIYESLTASGIKVGGNDPIANTGAHLSSDDRFLSLGDGEWGLIDWQMPNANGQNGQPPPMAGLRFAIGDQVFVPYDGDDVHVLHLGKTGEIIRPMTAGETGNATIGRTGKTLPPHLWYLVTFHESGKSYFIHESWLEPGGPPDEDVDDLPF